jgi:hypothetical protein
LRIQVGGGGAIVATKPVSGPFCLAGSGALSLRGTGTFLIQHLNVVPPITNASTRVYVGEEAANIVCVKMATNQVYTNVATTAQSASQEACVYSADWSSPNLNGVGLTLPTGRTAIVGASTLTHTPTVVGFQVSTPASASPQWCDVDFSAPLSARFLVSFLVRRLRVQVKLVSVCEALQISSAGECGNA